MLSVLKTSHGKSICLIFISILFNIQLFGNILKETNSKANLTSASVKESRHFNFARAVTSVDEQEQHDSFNQNGFIDGDPLDSMQHYILKARSVIAKVRELQNFIHFLDNASNISLPVGISKNVGGMEYLLAIDAIRLNATHAEFDAYMEVTIPQQDKILTFMGRGLKMSNSGGIVGDARLELVGNFAINSENDKIQLLLKGTANSPVGTFVTVDCDGFKSLSIDASIIFSRDLVIPEDIMGNPIDGRVSSDFTLQMEDWNDLLVTINLPAFQSPQLPNLGFTVKEAVLDFSDFRNAPATTFPQNYQSAALLSGEPNLWRGVYIHEVSIRLPHQFKRRGNENRVEFAAYDLLIDDLGVSGLFSARNLINLEDGDLSGWAFSVTDLSVELQANQIIAAGFGGDLVLPISEVSTPLKYDAFISSGGEYRFAVANTETLSFPIWNAGEVNIYESSSLSISVVNRAFLPSANLHGDMSIKAPGGDLSLVDLQFESLHIQTITPYVTVGNFSLGSGAVTQALSGFPISIQEIGLKSLSDNELALSLNVTVSLIGEQDGGFGGEGGLLIVGKQSEGNQWKYDRIELSKIGIAFNNGAVNVKASVEWFKNDITYGSGFRGEAAMGIVDMFQVEAIALFGKTADTRYWFVDALTELPPGNAGPISFNAFGGGAYQHMAKSSESKSSLGASLSGLTYIPDADMGLGVTAYVALSTTGSPQVFNGEATLEILFNRSGGLQSLDIKGEAYFITPTIEFDLGSFGGKALAKLTDKATNVINSSMARSQMWANMHISYHGPSKTFEGNFETYVNVAGGLITGVGNNHRAGWAAIYFSPDEWYIHVGKPSDPLGLKILSVVTTESYFMVGDRLEGSPPPPDNVSEILGNIDLDYMADMNLIKGGQGIAFGSRFSMDTGDLTFLMFYARFAAGMGFDVMIKNYGNLTCEGETDPLGINGWYANGQAFAYFEGEIGIRVKIFGTKREVEILNIGAAAILQAKLPNPFWMRGVVGGRFSVLNGLVKGNCKFEVVIGEECKITGASVLESLQVIASIDPDKQNDVSVFNAPRASFNFELNKTFEMLDLDDQMKKFRIKLEEFEVTDENSRKQTGTIEWNQYNDVAVFRMAEVLPSQQNLNVKVRVSFEEERDGVWLPVKVQGNIVVEEKLANFKTGLEPDHIPHHNVAYSYPVINQMNFHKDEVSEGYIQLVTAQRRPFEVQNGFRQMGRFTSSTGGQHTFNFNYDQGKGLIAYNVPKDLQNGTSYHFELVNVPVSKSYSLDQDISRIDQKIALNSSIDSLELTVRQTTSTGTVTILKEKNIFSNYMRTSSFGTFAQKVKAIEYESPYSWPLFTGVHEIGANLSVPEPFDKFEMQNHERFDALVRFDASGQSSWFVNLINPLLYRDFLNSGLNIYWRNDLEEYGLPPLKAIYIFQAGNHLVMDEQQFKSNFTSTGPGKATIIYNLPFVGYKDYIDLSTQAANSSVNSPYFNGLRNSSYPSIQSGIYQINMHYVLPGINRVTSTTTYNLNIE